MTKENKLDSILEAIFALDNPKIAGSRKEQVNNFIISTVNGDNPIAHLAVNIKNGVVAYILTDKRLIKIDIDVKDIQTSSFKLSTIVSVKRMLIDDEKEQFDIVFQNDSLGLKYPTANKEITEFFQKVEQCYLENF